MPEVKPSEIETFASIKVVLDLGCVVEDVEGADGHSPGA